jgi:hypothetical protein
MQTEEDAEEDVVVEVIAVEDVESEEVKSSEIGENGEPSGDPRTASDSHKHTDIDYARLKRQLEAVRYYLQEVLTSGRADALLNISNSSFLQPTEQDDGISTANASGGDVNYKFADSFNKTYRKKGDTSHDGKKGDTDTRSGNASPGRKVNRVKAQALEDHIRRISTTNTISSGMKISPRLPPADLDMEGVEGAGGSDPAGACLYVDTMPRASASSAYEYVGETPASAITAFDEVDDIPNLGTGAGTVLISPTHSYDSKSLHYTVELISPVHRKSKTASEPGLGDITEDTDALPDLSNVQISECMSSSKSGHNSYSEYHGSPEMTVDLDVDAITEFGSPDTIGFRTPTDTISGGAGIRYELLGEEQPGMLSATHGSRQSMGSFFPAAAAGDPAGDGDAYEHEDLLGESISVPSASDDAPDPNLNSKPLHRVAEATAGISRRPSAMLRALQPIARERERSWGRISQNRHYRCF